MASVSDSQEHVSYGDVSPIAKLPRSSKELIVLICMGMGLVVYGLMRGWWSPTSMAMWVVVATVMAVGGFVVVVLVQRRDALLWQCVGAVAALVLALNISVWWLSGADRVPNAAWRYWQLMLAVTLFIGMAWVQSVLQSRSLRAVRYSSLFVHAWHNTMVLGMVLQFVGLCWLVLALWGGLFLLVKVEFFAISFSEPLFICLATGLMAGMGVVLARGQPRPLQLQLQLVLALFRVLLPLLALVVVLFIVTLPFTGVQPLWDTRRAAALLVVVQLCVLLFVNAVFQDGLQEAAPYPSPLTALVHAALILLPVLGGLAVWAVVLRVQQYGWTYDRVWALVVTGLLLIYSLGYAGHAVQRDRFLWLQGLGRFNAGMSWLIIGIVVLLHTPLLDVYRLSAASQLHRLLRDEAPWDLAQLQNLRFDHGRYGEAALAQIAQDARAQVPEVQTALQQVQNADRKQHLLRSKSPEVAVVKGKPLKERVQIANGHTAPESAWWEAVEIGRLRSYASPCMKENLSADNACVVMQLALQVDGPALPLLCRMHELSPSCVVFGQDVQGLWRYEGQISWGAVKHELRPALKQAIREGALRVEAPVWQAVGVQGLDVQQGQLRPRSD